MYNNFLRYGIAALVAALALAYNMPQAFSTLDQAYDSPIARLNPAQIEAGEWLKENIDEISNVSIIGPPPQIMSKVWWMSSITNRVTNYFEGFLTWGRYKNNPEIAKGHLIEDYIVFDYSDITLFSRELIEQWLAFEQQNMGNHTLIYNKDSIRVYKYEAR